jgi:hypothetical protein
MPSQSPKAALQVGRQMPPAHMVVPFGLMHWFPHEPQCAVVFSGWHNPVPSQFE